MSQESESVAQQLEPTQSQPEAETDHDGNVEFECLEPSHLQGSVHVVVQALDNQWLPRKLLYKALNEEPSIGLDAELQQHVRSEYIRALINSEAVDINRAFLYNNQAVSEDYTQGSPSREAFKDLLKYGIIKPYLYKERSPAEKPDFTVTPAFTAWQQICQEVQTQCIRLSWDDETNNTLTRELLARRFDNFATNASSGVMKKYLQDLRVDESKEDALKNRLLDLAETCTSLKRKEKKDLIAREDLYKIFVTAGSPAEKRYDVSKAFAGEIKQLLDLAYNSYLPDALGGYLLTPIDTLPRVALQELDLALKQPETTTDELMNLLPTNCATRCNP